MMMQLEEFTIAPRSRIITYLWGLRDAQNLIDIAMKKKHFFGPTPKVQHYLLDGIKCVLIALCSLLWDEGQMSCKHKDSKSMTCLTAQPRKRETTSKARFWAKCSHKPCFLIRVWKRKHGE